MVAVDTNILVYAHREEYAASHNDAMFPDLKTRNPFGKS
jgi:hypothetical protein